MEMRFSYIFICLVVWSVAGFSQTVGFCKLSCIRSDKNEIYYDLPVNAQPYNSLIECQSTEPVLCQGIRVSALVPLCAETLRKSLHSTETLNWSDRDLVNGLGHIQAQFWCGDNFVPNFDKAPEPKKIPIPNLSPVPKPDPKLGPLQRGPGSGMYYRDIEPENDGVLKDLRYLVKHIYDNGPLSIILAVSAILVVLLGVKGVETVIGGPLAAEPATVFAALAAIIAIAINAEILDEGMRERYKKYSFNLNVERTAEGYVFESQDGIEEIRLDIDDNSWIVEADGKCTQGQTTQNLIATINGDC